MLVTQILLARLLSPEDFGLFAIGIAIMAFSEGLTTTGFDSALIQRQRDTITYLNAAWTIEVVRSIALFGILFAAAPYLAAFFDAPQAALLVRVVGVGLLLRGFRNVGAVFFRKDLDFRRQFYFELMPIVANVAVTVPLAIALGNVWALIWGHVAAGACLALSSYALHPYRPRLDFDLRKAAELFSFGGWILGSSVLVMVREQGLTMFIGKMFGVPALGIYNRAATFSGLAFQQFADVVWKVGYPASSRLQSDKQRFKKGYLQMLILLTFIGFPLAGGLYFLADAFVQVLLSEEWAPIVPIMQILSIQAFLILLNTPSAVVLQAAGRPALNTKISFWAVVVMVVLVYPLSSRWGLQGAPLAFLVGVLLTSPVLWHHAMRVSGTTLPEFARPIGVATASTIGMLAGLEFMKLGAPRSFPMLMVCILAGGILYLLGSFALDRIFKQGIFQLIRSKIASFRQ